MDLEKETKEEENISKTIVCQKGNILLSSYKHPTNNLKAYRLDYDFKSVDPEKINIKNLLSHAIYGLLEKLNPDLIEKIHILNQISEDEADILLLLKHIAKEVGIKQKYILFRTSRKIDFNNNTIEFINKDLTLIDNNLVNYYLGNLNFKNINLGNKYEPLLFNYGTSKITLKNIKNSEIINLTTEENFTSKMDIDFVIDFQLLMKDELPIYMENLTGLMFKKIFHNLKQFIDTLGKET